MTEDAFPPDAYASIEQYGKALPPATLQHSAVSVAAESSLGLTVLQGPYELAAALWLLAPDVMERSSIRVAVLDDRAVDEGRWWRVTEGFVDYQCGVRVTQYPATEPCIDDASTRLAPMLGNSRPRLRNDNFERACSKDGFPDVVFLRVPFAPRSRAELPAFAWIAEALHQGTVILGCVDYEIEADLVCEIYRSLGFGEQEYTNITYRMRASDPGVWSRWLFAIRPTQEEALELGHLIDAHLRFYDLMHRCGAQCALSGTLVRTESRTYAVGLACNAVDIRTGERFIASDYRLEQSPNGWKEVWLPEPDFEPYPGRPEAWTARDPDVVASWSALQIASLAESAFPCMLLRDTDTDGG